MDNEHLNHVMEASDELLHHDPNHLGMEVEVSKVHKVLQVTTIAALHEDVVAAIRLDGFGDSYDIITVNGILVLNLCNDESLILLVLVLPRSYLTSVVLASTGLRLGYVVAHRASCNLESSELVVIGYFGRWIHLSELALTQLLVHLDEVIAHFLQRRGLLVASRAALLAKGTR